MSNAANAVVVLALALVPGCTADGAASPRAASAPDTGRGDPGVAAVAGSAQAERPGSSAANGRVALVYRGPGGCVGCSESVAAVLASSSQRFVVKFVGPAETTKLTAASLATAAVYAQPGGDGSVAAGWAALREYATILQSFVGEGGRYLGFCMGAYLAGREPGFDLLPGDTDQFIASTGASVTTTDDTTTDVLWRGNKRAVYFQDGPFFLVEEGAPNVTVLATYASNREVAAIVARYKKGVVGVVGPHPEAPQAWYDAAGITDPDGLDSDLARDLIDTTMR